MSSVGGWWHFVEMEVTPKLRGKLNSVPHRHSESLALSAIVYLQMEQRFHHAMKYQASIGTTAPSESDASGAMCDMACQTRWVMETSFAAQNEQHRHFP